MRIAMVSAHAGSLAAAGAGAGEVNVHVEGLAAALARRGAEVVVHARAGAPGLPRRVASAPGVTVEHVPAGPPRELSDAELLPHVGAFARHLLAAWDAERPDVVHAHSWTSGWAALTAARGVDVPVVLTYHGLGVVAARHPGTAGTRPDERIPVESYLAREVDGVVAGSAEELSELVRVGAPRRKVSVVPAGVDLERFTPTGPAERRTEGLRRVLLVGPPSERSGAADVVAALAGVPATELVVAGGADADPAVRPLRALAERAGVADRVTYRAGVHRAALPALYRSADVVACVPWYEPSGIPALEAMACGVPVVASAVGGLPDIVADGHTGVLVPPRDPARLATALRRLLGDELLRAGLGFAAEDRARARYGWDRIANETLAVYERATAARNVLL